jgi:hypothetical protein
VRDLRRKTHCSAGWLGEHSLGHHVVGFPPCILPPDDIFGRFLESAFNIAVATGRTVYDSIDLALARRSGASW